MRYRVISGGVFLAATVFVTAESAARRSDPNNVVVHEWGTFTSVAGEDGRAVSWYAFGGRDDLPCFVDRAPVGPKASLWGTIRMETPVLYFYSPEETTLAVNVRFRQGAITEWFPKAVVTPTTLDYRHDLGANDGTAAWTRVRVLPRATQEYPQEDPPSHYYAARHTDAAPVQVGQQKEKFLFYRGVAAFAPPLTASIHQDGRVTATSIWDAPLGSLVLFENHGGAIRFEALSGAGPRASLNLASSRQTSLPELKAQLEQMLMDEGLYPKEARAMLATWDDSWFEEGARLLYIVPRAFVDHVLPLDINPRPQEVTRVFVGRLELLTRATLDQARQAIIANDPAVFTKYGRFFDPILSRLIATASAQEKWRFERSRDQMFTSWKPALAGC
jgi:hypothetical protein